MNTEINTAEKPLQMYAETLGLTVKAVDSIHLEVYDGEVCVCPARYSVDVADFLHAADLGQKSANAMKIPYLGDSDGFHKALQDIFPDTDLDDGSGDDPTALENASEENTEPKSEVTTSPEPVGESGATKSKPSPDAPYTPYTLSEAIDPHSKYMHDNSVSEGHEFLNSGVSSFNVGLDNKCIVKENGDIHLLNANRAIVYDPILVLSDVPF